MCNIVEVAFDKKCKVKDKGVFESTKFASCDINNNGCFEKNIGLEIMKIMRFEGKGLGSSMGKESESPFNQL